jgi:hypothetical protein
VLVAVSVAVLVGVALGVDVAVCVDVVLAGVGLAPGTAASACVVHGVDQLVDRHFRVVVEVERLAERQRLGAQGEHDAADDLIDADPPDSSRSLRDARPSTSPLTRTHWIR